MHAISVIADRSLDMFLLLFMLSADHKRSGSHRRMMVERLGKWKDEEFTFIKNIRFKDGRSQGNASKHETSVSELFGFYANAKAHIAQNPRYEDEKNLTFLQQRVLNWVSNRALHKVSVSKEYCALVEQLNNLTM